jgi:hypothetical protein
MESLMESQEQIVVERLKDFTQAMNEWEKKFYPLMRTEGPKGQAQASEGLRPIFEEYVVHTDKNFSRVHAPSAGEPPEYDNEQTVIEGVEVAKKTAIICVQENRLPKGVFRYTLKNEKDKWILRKKEKYSPSNDKWSNYHF